MQRTVHFDCLHLNLMDLSTISLISSAFLELGIGVATGVSFNRPTTTATRQLVPLEYYQDELNSTSIAEVSVVLVHIEPSRFTIS